MKTTALLDGILAVERMDWQMRSYRSYEARAFLVAIRAELDRRIPTTETP